jgi:hypothetical protein
MRRIRRRAEIGSLAASSLLHVSALFLLSASLQPIDLGQVGKQVLTAEMAAEPEPQPLNVLDLPDQAHEPDESVDDLAASPFAFTTGDDAPGGAGVADGLVLDQPATFLAPPPDPSSLTSLEKAAELPLSDLSERRPDAARAGRQASFFGTVAHGDAFVFILDVSGSMKGSRFERAREELSKSVAALREDQSFFVVLFSDRTRCMFDLPAGEAKTVPATDENIDRLQQWLAGITPDGGTDPREALRIGLAVRPSAVFLLSDGEFNSENASTKRGLRHGDSSVADMIEKGRRRNRRRQVPIHGFAYENPSAAKTMEALATDTGGEYRFVPALDGPSKPAVANTTPPAAPQPKAPPAPPPVNIIAAPGNNALATVLGDAAATDDPQLAGVLAAALLARAEASEVRGDFGGALEGYQAIIDDYPRTEAARRANEHKAVLSLVFASPSN